MNYIAEDILMHYGIKRRSGRYPYGSGDNPYQRTGDFLSRVEELKKTGWTETPENIEKAFGLTTTQYRIEKAICKDERRTLNVDRAKSLKADGLGATEIARQMGTTESTVRSWLNEKSEAKMREAKNAAAFIKEQVDTRGMIDVGKGAEIELNISAEKLKQAIWLVEREGYPVYNNRFEQVTNRGKFTTQKVICPPGTEYKEIYNLDQVHSLKEYISRDGGATFEKKFTYPSSMDSKRMMIRYKEEGGEDKDGIVELRRGVEDLSLGESRYSQVRILVDGTHYIKGMAVYSDNMPEGVDVVFNTNKKQGTPKMDVLKKIKDDPDNPFGSAIKDADQGGQYWYTDSKTGEKKLGLINKRADEGDWTDWKDTLPSQFLGKQSQSMAKKQLDLAKADKMAEFEEILSLENPTIKKHYLQEFADSCDSAAVHLKAAALPGQKYHVIIPVNTLKDTEVFAPQYKDGTKLALVRYPHGGTFEIPILTVNNRHGAARDLIGTSSIDAVGINKKIADRLSGADFDGDTVMCIPTHDSQGRVKITSTRPLEGLEGFDPKMEYGPETYKDREVKLMTKKGTQTQMGVVSNLITDMTLLGASEEELARAVRHSMVVIDAEKHKLDYKRSEKDNNIAALKNKYQIRIDENGNEHHGGATTILSRAKGEHSVVKRQGNPKINIKGEDWYDPSKPEGSLIYKDADDRFRPVKATNKKTGIVTLTTSDGQKIKYDPNNKEEADKYRPIKKKDPVTKEITYTNKAGDISYKLEEKTQKSTHMAETDDAYSLVSAARHPMELIYADYANNMKSLANQARVEMVNTGKIAYSKDAAKKYDAEVQSLKSKLAIAELNAPRERAATRMANYEVSEKQKKYKQEYGTNMDNSDVKKASQQAITKYRQEVGSIKRSDRSIKISDKEWEAIQAGAISESRLTRILNNTDVDNLRQRAMPKTTTSITPARQSKIKAMSATYTIQEIAEATNLSPSTISNILRGKE